MINNDTKVIYDHVGIVPHGVILNKVYAIEELLKILPMEKIKILFKTTDSKSLDYIDIENKEKVNIEIETEVKEVTVQKPINNNINKSIIKDKKYNKEID